MSDEEPVAAGHVGPLPEPVRARVVGLAADALGALPLEEVPPALRPVAHFTPSKRARLGAAQLAAAIDADDEFRERVAAHVRDRLPSVAEALADGRAPAAAPPVDVAAAAYLLREGDWAAVVADAVTSVEHDLAVRGAAERAAEEARAAAALEAARAAGRTEAARRRAELDRLRTDNDALRHRLGVARERARRAEAELETLRQSAASAAAAAEARVAGLEAELRRARRRVSDLEAAAETARRAVREGRSVDDARLWLLVETLVNAAAGLRRELALPPPDVRPADLVGASGGDQPAVEPFAGVAARGLDRDDPAVFDQLLALPGVHLVVDGYNVTKLGYGGLPLEAQRSRLLAALGAVAARRGCEVTCVFDGADLTGPVQANAPRGVRLLFSAAGETADELIRRLVRAEPPGRPVVVVSTDREVAEGVRRSGAWPVSSTALLRRIERG